MINGIPVKIKVESEAGADCETVYFATYRKCPALAERTRRIARLEIEVKASERMRMIAERAMEDAATAEDVERASAAMGAAMEAAMAAQDAIVAEFEAFVREGLKAAGYDDENAVRIAAAIPLSRVGELVGAARIGSGVVDFFGV
jgi:hypothetical protein